MAYNAAIYLGIISGCIFLAIFITYLCRACSSRRNNGVGMVYSTEPVGTATVQYATAYPIQGQQNAHYVQPTVGVPAYSRPGIYSQSAFNYQTNSVVQPIPLNPSHLHSSTSTNPKTNSHLNYGFQFEDPPPPYPEVGRESV